MPQQEHLTKGLMFILISAACSAAMGAFVKLLGHDVPTSMSVFFRFLFSFCLMLPWVLHDKQFHFKIAQPKLLLLRCFAGVLSISIFFYVIHYIPLVDAALLNKTSTLFIPLLVLIWFRLQTPLKVWAGVIIGFVGVAFVLHPGRDIFHAMAIVGLFSGVFAGVSVLSIRRLSRTDSVTQILFYYYLFGLIVTGAVAALQWQHITWHMLWLLCGVGLFGTGYQVFLTLAYVTASARILSPVSYITVLFAGILAWAIWDVVPDKWGMLGIVLVILGGLIAVLTGRKGLPRSQ